MPVDRSVIAGLVPFADIPAPALDEIRHAGRSAAYPKGSIVFEQSGAPDRFFVLLQGRIRVSRTTPGGDEVIVRYISPGQTFGIAVAMGLPAYPATAMAAQDSVALSWPSSFWNRLIAIHPQIATGTLQTVGERLQDANSRVVELSTEQADRRLAHTLLRLAKQAGRKTDRGIVIDFPVTREDLAQMTGTTLFTVSRILSAWADRDLVESDRRHITIRDAHRLLLLAEDSEQQ